MSFILWVSPVIISVALAAMAYMCHLLADQFDERAIEVTRSGGETAWQLDVKGEVESRPAIVDGVAFITTEESQLLLAIDAVSGKVKWSYAGAAEELNGSPAVSRDDAKNRLPCRFLRHPRYTSFWT